MASINDDLMVKYEKWLLDKIKAYNSEVDESLINYITSIISDEETPDEDKTESIDATILLSNKILVLVL